MLPSWVGQGYTINYILVVVLLLVVGQGAQNEWMRCQEEREREFVIVVLHIALAKAPLGPNVRVSSKKLVILNIRWPLECSTLLHSHSLTLSPVAIWAPTFTVHVPVRKVVIALHRRHGRLMSCSTKLPPTTFHTVASCCYASSDSHFIGNIIICPSISMWGN